MEKSYPMFVIYHPGRDEFYTGTLYGPDYDKEPRFYTSNRNAKLSFARATRQLKYYTRQLKAYPDHRHYKDRLAQFQDCIDNCKIMECTVTVKGEV